LTVIQTILIYAIPILFAITVHEVAHGWVANRLGDPTARMLGRLTLNPIKHIDPVGTIFVPFVVFYLSGFIFGWAKPVPITWQNLRHPRRDMAIVALAGPMSNLLMAFLWALLAKSGETLAQAYDGWGPAVALITMGEAGIFINLILMVLNLIPIPPLDGSKVLSSFLPPKASYWLGRYEWIGLILLLILIWAGLLGGVLLPIVSRIGSFILKIFGL
jgi:Zn-dependent protease